MCVYVYMYTYMHAFQRALSDVVFCYESFPARRGFMLGFGRASRSPKLQEGVCEQRFRWGLKFSDFGDRRTLNSWSLYIQ